MIGKGSRSIAVAAGLGLFAFCFACQPAPSPETAAEIQPLRDGLFMHISHGIQHPHRVLMGLRMAEMMSADRDVLIYFDVRGVEVVSRDQVLESEGFDSSVAILGRLIEANVPVYVCPTCVEKAGKTLEDLLEGVRFAEKDQFFNFTQGRILSLAY